MSLDFSPRQATPATPERPPDEASALPSVPRPPPAVTLSVALLLGSPAALHSGDTVVNSADLTACTGGPVSSGHHRFGPFRTTASCLYTPPAGPDAFDLTWNDGTTSHYEGTYTVLTTCWSRIRPAGAACAGRSRLPRRAAAGYYRRGA